MLINIVDVIDGALVNAIALTGRRVSVAVDRWDTGVAWILVLAGRAVASQPHRPPLFSADGTGSGACPA